MKSNKVKHTKHLEECAEYILENKSGWTQFTTWAREKYDINNKQANTLWKEAWEVLTADFADNIKHTVEQTLIELEQVKESAISDNDRKVWLEVIKYQNKIRGGEIEKQQIDIKGDININLSWGSENLNTIDSADVE
jgi:hypothetical protein